MFSELKLTIKLVATLFVVVFFLWCINACAPAQSSVSETKVVEITDSVPVSDVTYQLGELSFRAQTKLKLVLKNSLETPLVINEVRQFCGCTRPRYDSTPVVPGSSGEIEILFVADHTGLFSKSLKVYISSQEKPFQILFKGTVVKNETQP